MIWGTLVHQCLLNLPKKCSFSGVWSLISLALIEMLFQVNMIQKDIRIQIRAVEGWNFLVVPKSKCSFSIYIQNSINTEQPKNTMTCIFRKLFRCMKVMDCQDFHQLMCSSTWSTHSLRNWKTQPLNWSRIAISNWSKLPLVLLKKSSKGSHPWYQKWWKSLSKYWARSVKGLGKLLKPFLTLSKNIFSLMIGTTKRIDLKLFKIMDPDNRWINLVVSRDSNQDNQVCHNSNNKCVVVLKMVATFLSKNCVKELMTTSASCWEMWRTLFLRQ